MEGPAIDAAAEEAACIHARAVVRADIGTTVLGMTPEAFAKAMLLGNTTWTYLDSEVTAAGRAGDDYLFDIVYRTDEETIRLRYRFRNIEGEWKVVDLEQLD